MLEHQKLFALLIDGDNTRIEYIQVALQKLRDFGELRISKVFHNKSTIEQWEQIAGQYSIDPVWVPNNVKGKNSVDIALVMDAMSLRYERPEIVGFCIMSSDGDYTRLARYLRSQGKFVLGIGEAKTPEPLRKACTEFFCVDEVETDSTTVERKAREAEFVAPSKAMSDTDFMKLIVEAYGQVEVTKSHNGTDGWVQLRDARDRMGQLNLDFQATDYYKNLRVMADKVKALAKTEPQLIAIYEDTDSKFIVHHVRILRDREIDKFRQAYKHASDVLKQKNSDGWVLLSVIRGTLLELHPDFQALVYRDVKYKQIKKVVEKMVGDYPETIELDLNSEHPKIRMK